MAAYERAYRENVSLKSLINVEIQEQQAPPKEFPPAPVELKSETIVSMMVIIKDP